MFSLANYFSLTALGYDSTLLVFLQLCKAQQSIYAKTGRGATPKHMMCQTVTRTAKLLTCDFKELNSSIYEKI